MRFGEKLNLIPRDNCLNHHDPADIPSLVYCGIFPRRENVEHRQLFTPVTCRQEHNQLGIVCFTFSEIKKFFENISFMHKTFVGYVGHMILQDFQLDFLGFQKIYI